MSTKKQSIREAVLEFLATPTKDKSERYNRAFELYRQSPGKDSFQERDYNNGYSDYKLKNLLYDLQKVNGIKDIEVWEQGKVIAMVPAADIANAPEPEAEKHVDPSKQLTDDPFAKPENETAPDKFTPTPETEERKRIRDEFPFLDDPDCPVELRALVTDKVTAYRAYAIAQNKLQAHRNGTAVIEDQAELDAVIKAAVDDFEANRAIYDELNHYKAHGRVLGVHPIFNVLTLQREVNSMGKAEMVKFVEGEKKFISTKKAQITKAKGDAEKIADIEKAINDHAQKMVLVKRKLETLSAE